MNPIPNLVSLHDGRPGLRTLLQIEAREPVAAEHSPSPGGEGRGEGGTASPAVLDFISSTGTLDRYHEIIDPAGWHLDAYRRNPVFQNAHNYGDILFTLGKALITEIRSGLNAPKQSEGGSPVLFQRIQFATDINPIARIAYGLYRDGFLRAVSVGFVPLRWEDGNGKERASNTTESQPFRRKYLEQELLEVSAVAIPANPNALALGLKSGSIAKSDLKDTLDLLCVLTIDDGSPRPPRDVSQTSITPRLHHSISLLPFARELRRILRRN